jgi:hypothetical protein
MSTLRTTACAAALLMATAFSLSGCDRKSDTTTASPGGTTSPSQSATPPASPASPVSK